MRIRLEPDLPHELAAKVESKTLDHVSAYVLGYRQGLLVKSDPSQILEMLETGGLGYAGTRAALLQLADLVLIQMIRDGGARPLTVPP